MKWSLAALSLLYPSCPWILLGKRIGKIQQDGLPRRWHHILSHYLQEQKTLPRVSQKCYPFFLILSSQMQISPEFFHLFWVPTQYETMSSGTQVDLVLDGCMTGKEILNPFFPPCNPPVPAILLISPKSSLNSVFSSTISPPKNLPVSSPQTSASLFNGLFYCSSKADFCLHKDGFSSWGH